MFKRMSIGLVIGKKLKLIINMELQEKLDLNKQIRAYSGDNSFILSLQKQLKTSKYLERVEVGKRKVKILSDKQYEAAKSALI